MASISNIQAALHYPRNMANVAHTHVDTLLEFLPSLLTFLASAYRAPTYFDGGFSQSPCPSQDVQHTPRAIGVMKTSDVAA